MEAVNSLENRNQLGQSFLGLPDFLDPKLAWFEKLELKRSIKIVSTSLKEKMKILVLFLERPSSYFCSIWEEILDSLNSLVSFQ